MNVDDEKRDKITVSGFEIRPSAKLIQLISSALVECDFIEKSTGARPTVVFVPLQSANNTELSLGDIRVSGDLTIRVSAMCPTDHMMFSRAIRGHVEVQKKAK